MRNRISAALLAAALPFAVLHAARAAVPSPAAADASVRAEGNRKDVARAIGDRVFKTEWPAQVVKVAADGIDGTVVVGLHVSGVKLHRRITQAQFAKEIATVARIAFAASSSVEEVDVWATVPVRVANGADVSGDLAMPTVRTVFSATILRGEPAAALLERLQTSNGVYWDEEWTRALFKERA